MANASYDNMWQEAMGDLHEQLHVEGVEDEDGDEAEKGNLPEVTIFQAFQHFACLYIKYLQIFKKLDSCYDCMIHPQKRIHVKKVLELVIRRMIELKSDLVKWNPPNSYLRMPSGPEVAFPWEYVHLDDILVDLKLPPETLEISIPKYFKEDNIRQIEQRDKLVNGYMRIKLGTDEVFIADKFENAAALEPLSVERAVEIIMRNERGRQGINKAITKKATHDKNDNQGVYETSQNDMDKTVAATNMQRMARGFLYRRIAMKERQNELEFVAMKPRKDDVEVLDNELQMAYRKRKQEQVENKEAYEKALDDLKEIILDEEGPDQREQLREERTLWVTDQIAQDKFPTDLEEFYLMKKGDEEEEAEKAEAKDAKADKKDDKKGDKKGGDKKDKKGKGAEEPEAEAMPKLQSKTELTENMAKLVVDYEEVWESKDETDNFQQKHDVELGKTVVRPGVYEELRKQVDDMLVINLKKIQMQIAPAGKKGKKAKGKKKKKGKKGGKGKKKKPLPGEKLAKMRDRDSDTLLNDLIQANLVVRPHNRGLSSLIGDFNYLGSMHHNADRREEGTWQPQDPSISQIRQMLTEYCILPNGSADVKMALPAEKLIKSVMLYGPSGTGKTLAVEAVAQELGALLIHLTPEKLRGNFPGKSGPTELVHTVMTVARDPAFQPVVVYIDECELFFTGGKKNKDKDGPSRFKKDLLTYKNQALGPEHRVIVIGSTSHPENGDMKDMKAFFDKFIYMPYPDYSSRVLIFQYYLDVQLRMGFTKGEDNTNLLNARGAYDTAEKEVELVSKVRKAIASVDISSLAHISEGYSAGAIARTVRSVVSSRRCSVLNKRPLNSIDFVDNLSMQPVTYQDDRATFLAFTKTVTGLDDRRKKIEAMVSGEAEQKGKDAKGKKK